MTVFTDASALVKLYADEAGQAEVRALAEPIVVSHLSRVEVPSALWRKQRLGEINLDDAAMLTTVFESDWYGDENGPPRFEVIRLTPTVLEDASRLVAFHGLRAGDGIQLACARAAAAVLTGLRAVVAFDGALRAAAIAERFAVLPVGGR